MRVATLDIGTNSVLLLAAERGPDGWRILSERIDITRLGRGVDRTGELSEEGLAATLDAVRRFADEARALGCTELRATATSAARDARNGHVLVERAAALGVTVEIIAGAREAQLSFNAVAAGRPGPLAVIDIGGGSTEIIVGEAGRIDWRHSFDVGSVRLTERLLRGDPPTAASLADADALLARTFEALPRPPAGAPVVGIAGTFTTLASILLQMTRFDRDRIRGYALPLAELDALASRLASLPLAERRLLPGLPAGRADVIVAGARVAAAAVRALGATTVQIDDRGLRWGFLFDLFGA
jgi:exopolyphosphatase/guanosine-5'-triphosphate,3'-diphosphate pyrophosphatase